MDKKDTVSTSFRLPKETIDQMEELAKVLKESKTQVIALAVGRLYNDRAAVAKEDFATRIGRTSSGN